MDSESQQIYECMTLHRLSLKHPGWQSPQVAKATGRSERWVRQWLRRFAHVEDPHFI